MQPNETQTPAQAPVATPVTSVTPPVVEPSATPPVVPADGAGKLAPPDPVKELSGHAEGTVLPTGEKIVASYGPEIVFDASGNPVVDEKGEVTYKLDAEGKPLQVFLGWHKESA